LTTPSFSITGLTSCKQVNSLLSEDRKGAAGKLLLNRHKEELPFGFTGEVHDFYSGLI